MEELLTIEELQAIVEAGREKEHRGYKFAASLKGIDLDEGNSEHPTLQDIQDRVDAKLAGMHPDDIALTRDLGIVIEAGDDDD
jgi:hypothetical protein